MVVGGGSLARLEEAACSLASEISSVPKDGRVLIVSHLDADGLSSGGIILQALLRAGFSPMIRIVKQLDGEAIAEISRHPCSHVILTDMGSGQKSLLNALDKQIFVMDHHQPEAAETGSTAKSRLSEFNPHLYGFDGSSEISAAGTSYMIAVRMDEANRSLVNLAIVGALGDLQDKGDRSTLVGLNAGFVDEAVKGGILQMKKGLKLYGFESRPLVQCMAYSLDPYLPSLTGDEGACLKFIKNLGIDPRKADGAWKSIADLSSDEQRAIINGMITYLISQGLPSKDAEKIVGTIYVFSCEAADGPLRDAREFASTINACGRLGRFGLGISIALGDRNRAYAELMEVMQEYRRTIAGYLKWLEANRESAVKILPHVQAIFGGTQIDDKIIGTIISMAMSVKPFVKDRPIIGFASCSGVTKVSARGTAEQVKMGLNLGNIMKEASESLGGAGGGHNIAAGAQIPSGKEEAFLSLVDDYVSKSLSGAKD
jgi:RecJ-like exonuclease